MGHRHVPPQVLTAGVGTVSFSSPARCTVLGLFTCYSLHHSKKGMLAELLDL